MFKFALIWAGAYPLVGRCMLEKSLFFYGTDVYFPAIALPPCGSLFTVLWRFDCDLLAEVLA